MYNRSKTYLLFYSCCTSWLNAHEAALCVFETVREHESGRQGVLWPKQLRMQPYPSSRSLTRSKASSSPDLLGEEKHRRHVEGETNIGSIFSFQCSQRLDRKLKRIDDGKTAWLASKFTAFDDDHERLRCGRAGRRNALFLSRTKPRIERQLPR